MVSIVDQCSFLLPTRTKLNAVILKMILESLGQTDDSTSQASSSVSSCFTQIVPALAQIVNVGMDNHLST